MPAPFSYDPTSAAAYSGGNNRITGLTYDDAGNLLGYGGQTLLYDGDGHVKQVKEGTAVTTEYVYDGEGRRVKKIQGDRSTYCIYDATGGLAAEYGGVVTTEVGRHYLTTDHLGSTRLVTDGAGSVVQRIDYEPFGLELAAGVGNRTETIRYALGNASGWLPLRFTGKERELKSDGSLMDLYYFGARYYGTSQGRWTSPDEFPGGSVDPFTGEQVGQPGPLPYADITNPQSLNKYAYVLNNPLRYTDPDGHFAIADDAVYLIAAAVAVTYIYYSLPPEQRDISKTVTAVAGAAASFLSPKPTAQESTQQMQTATPPAPGANKPDKDTNKQKQELSPREQASKKGGELVKKFKLEGVGKGAGRSGRHGTPHARASAELKRLANKLPKGELREAYKTQADRLLERAKGYNH
jgi:RHS repeat-associated protein